MHRKLSAPVFKAADGERSATYSHDAMPGQGDKQIAEAA